MDISFQIPDLAWRLLIGLRDHGNMTLAARQLGVSQPAATKALQKAEQILGVPLLRRDTRPLQLTEEGQTLADYALQRRHLDEVMLRRLETVRRTGVGLVRIASVGPSSSTRILPRLLAQIARHLPDIEIEIAELRDYEALEALDSGTADFATLLGADAARLESLPLAEDRLVALLPEAHPLALKHSVSVTDLAGQAFIMTKGGSEPLIRDWFRTAQQSPDVRHSVLQLTSILALVRAGLGVSMIAEMAVPESHPGIRVVALAPEQPRAIYLCRRPGSFASHAADRSWKALERILL